MSDPTETKEMRKEIFLKLAKEAGQILEETGISMLAYRFSEDPEDLTDSGVNPSENAPSLEPSATPVKSSDGGTSMPPR